MRAASIEKRRGRKLARIGNRVFYGRVELRKVGDFTTVSISITIRPPITGVEQ